MEDEWLLKAGPDGIKFLKCFLSELIIQCSAHAH